MRISDWSSDVCSSDLLRAHQPDEHRHVARRGEGELPVHPALDHLAGATIRGVERALPLAREVADDAVGFPHHELAFDHHRHTEIGRASCSESVCQYVKIAWFALTYKTKHIIT